MYCRCEYTGPKYALVTELEAKGRYLLDDEDLRALPFKKVKIKKFCVYFFLRSSVEKLALAKRLQFEGRYHSGMGKIEEEQKIENIVDASCSKFTTEAWAEAERNHSGSSGESDNDFFEDGMLAGDVSNIMVLTEESKSETSLHTSAEGSQNIFVQTSENTEQGLDREERKALRKEHKRQVKAENREKRMGKRMGKDSPQWELRLAENNWKNSLYLNDSSAGKAGTRTIGSGAGRNTSVEGQNADENLNTDERGKVKKKHRKTKREHVAASNGGYRQEQYLGYNSQLKTKSPSDWVKERHWLEVELGCYGISALELAQF
eukprot:Gb_14753 [translate_table: standard]